VWGFSRFPTGLGVLPAPNIIWTKVLTGWRILVNRNVHKNMRLHMCGPDFISLGQQKAGTTWLYQQLKSHPAFWLPPVKELHFFDNGFNFQMARRRLGNTVRMSNPPLTRNWRRLVENNIGENEYALDTLEIDLEFFRRVLLTRAARIQERKKRKNRGDAVFADCLDDKSFKFYADIFNISDRLSGDITPAYGVLSPQAIRKITGKFANTKFILQIRHPVSRAISHIRHYFRNGAIDEKSFENADAMANLMKVNPQFANNSLSSKIYENWSADVDDEKLMVMSLEQLIAEPLATRQKLADFLGVDGDGFTVPADSNPADSNPAKDRFKVELPSESIDYLKQFFAPEVSRCREIFGEHCAEWK